VATLGGYFLLKNCDYIKTLNFAMPRSKSPLRLSGALLVLSYAIFGWLSVTWRLPTPWVILVTMTVLANLIAIYFDRAMDTLLQGMFGANVRSLFCVMGLATFLVIILTKLPIFSYVLLIFATALLMSMDLHERYMSRITNFFLLIICQILGWGLGFGSNIFWWRAVHYWQHLPS
jgi:hypothetical protein